MPVAFPDGIFGTHATLEKQTRHTLVAIIMQILSLMPDIYSPGTERHHISIPGSLTTYPITAPMAAEIADTSESSLFQGGRQPVRFQHQIRSELLRRR